MSFARYPSYKDSGVEWLGQVPEHWEVRRLKSIVEEPLKYGANESAELDDRTLPRFVRITDIDDSGGLRDETFKSLPVEVATPYLLKEGDVLLARSGATVGKSFIYSAQWGTACFAGYLIRARLNHTTCLAEWLYYFCQSDEYWGYVVGTQIQSTIQNVSAEKYANLCMPLPHISEQTEIVAFLDRETEKIDELVAEQQRLMALLKEKRQTVISHAVTRGLNPDVPMKPSGIEWLGDVPAHWEVSPIKRFADKITDGAHVSPEIENGIFPFVSTKDVGADFIDFENCLRTSVQSFEYLVKTGCRPLIGDVLFSKDGTIGRTVVVREDRDFVVASSLIIIRPTARILDCNFLNCLCQSQSISNQVECFVKGAGLPRLSIQNLTKVIGCFPPLDEQKAIAGFLDVELAKFNTLTTEAQRAIHLLQERRTTLITAAVTGQIDVRSQV